MSVSHSKKSLARRAARSQQTHKEKLRYLFVFTLVAIGLALLTWQPRQSANPLVAEDVITLGASVYAQTCASCHGDQGEGHAALLSAPALNGSEHSWHHADGQIQQLIMEGGVEMPSFGAELADEEILAVVRFIQTWWSADKLAAQQRASQSNPLQ
jgi:mono/diheme cytochrome c family protein